MKSFIPFTTKVKPRPSDACDITIYHLSEGGEEAKEIDKGSGSYLENVIFGDTIYWKLYDPFHRWLLPADGLLDSDSLKRPDHFWIKEKDFD